MTKIGDIITAQRRARVGDRIEHGQDIPANVVRLIGHDRAFTPPVERAVVRVIEGADMCYWTGGHMEAWNEDEIPAKWFPLTVVEVAPEPQPANSLRCPTCDSAARLSQPAAAESGPLVLTLPEVPAGAVALVANEMDGDGEVRYHRQGGGWMRDGWSGEAESLVDILLDEDLTGSVTVEFAPPREPRIWPKIDYPAIDALPGLIDVEGHGRWLLTTWSQGVLYGQGAERKSLPELMVLGEVREVLGEVREVLGDA